MAIEVAFTDIRFVVLSSAVLLVLWHFFRNERTVKSQEPVSLNFTLGEESIERTQVENFQITLYADNSILKKRRNVLVFESTKPILRVFHRMQYLWNGPEIAWKAHTKDSPYAIPTPETYQVHFTSKEHVKQLVQASDEYLSLHALAKDMFQPKYTMDNLGFDDQMSANGSVHQRALQAELRFHLPALAQPLHDLISKSLDEELAKVASSPAQWHELKIFPMAKRLITATNALIFFGSEVSKDPVFLNAALEYPEHLMETAEVLRLMPSFIAPHIAPYLMRHNRALNVLLDRLVPIVEARVPQCGNANTEGMHVDCIQFFVNAVAQKNQKHEWPARRIIQVLLGVWFASVHQPAMCLFYALDDLCRHPEYVSELRNEIASAVDGNSPNNITNLPLLNGFLKESARLNPTDSISVRRKVLQQYTLQDGTSLAKDDVACVPLQPLLRNPEVYTEPLEFNPYRFVNSENGDKGRVGASTTLDFTNSSVDFPVWGLGKHACPGRYYASTLLKLIVAQIVQRYDVKMLDDTKQEKRYFYWRSAIVPREGAALYFRQRLAE